MAIALINSTIRDNVIVQHIFSGIRPAVAGLMLYAVTNLSKFLGFKIFNITIAISAFVAIAFFNIHPFLTIVIAGVLGLLSNKSRKGNK